VETSTSTRQVTTAKSAPKRFPRDIGLDALRGLLLILMTVNHVQSPFKGWTFDLLGFLSEAEGFVFLSGFVAGLTYTRFSVEQSDTAMRRRAVLRARTIYLYHIATFVTLYLVIRLFSHSHSRWPHWYDLYRQGPVIGLLLGLTLLNQPNYLDILPMYCAFMLVTPLSVSLFKRHRAWLVIMVSLTLWAALQLRIVASMGSALRVRSVPTHLGDFDVLAWQLLFVAGLLLGYRRYTRGRSSARPNGFVIWYVSLVGGALFLLRWHLFFDAAWAAKAESLARKSTLGPVRVLNFAAVYFLMAALCRDPRPRFILNGLAYLGRHSLQVFTWHVFVINLIHLLYDRGWAPGDFVQTTTLLASIGSSYMPAWLLERRKGRIRELPQVR